MSGSERRRQSSLEYDRERFGETLANRRARKLATTFYGAVKAHTKGSDRPESCPSLDTCKLSGTSGAVGRLENGGLSGEDLEVHEQDLLDVAFRLGVEDVDRAARIVRGRGDTVSALWAALDREEKRQEKVLELLERDMPGKAKRLALCKRQSVQLECPDEFSVGGCGSDDNFVPAGCGLRICPECATEAKAEKMETYKPVVQEMEHPMFATFTIENVDDLERGVDFLVDSLGKLRDRTIPTSGKTVRYNEDGERTVKRWEWSVSEANVEGLGGEDEEVEFWKPRLIETEGGRRLACRLENEYVHAEWTNITGVHRGKNIPFGELVEGGIYAIDIKIGESAEDGTYNIHVHVVMDGRFIPQAALSAVWEDITGSCVVDVRRIYDRSESGVEDALMETVGYALKEPELESVSDQVDYLEALEDRRMVNAFGDLYGSIPAQVTYLVCSNCGRIPLYWNYKGMVDTNHDNMGVVHGSSDHPPPGSGETVPEEALAE